MAVMMTWDPVLMSPRSLNPFPVFVVVAITPDLFASRVGAYIDGAEGLRIARHILTCNNFILITR
ncbi:MAG: hypothetical protein ABSG35_03960 [Syntrophobacteraceae bacterium]